MPLHIFEARYSQMLADCLEHDRQFGIVYLPAGNEETAIEAGSVGTIGRIESVVPLPNDRSNIVVTGTERFSFRDFADGEAPYHVALIDTYDDEDEDPRPLSDLAGQVRTQFARVSKAAKVLASDDSEPPALPNDPALLAFFIGSLLDLDAAARQQLLTVRSPLSRLVTIEALLTAAVGPLEQRAMVHSVAKQNGHGPRTAS